MKHSIKILLVFFLGMVALGVRAEWSGTLGAGSYFTDDVGLFSVTRRLSLKEDPTQPVVDRPNQGSDFVFEPQAEWGWEGANILGKISFLLEAGGYVFADHSEYSHGLYEAQVSQVLATDTKVSLLYNFVPNLYLGKNVLRPLNGEESEHDEQLSNHFWSIHVDRALNEDLTLRLLARYGLRKYDQPFQHRDTQFWTIGPHLEWAINPDMELLVGYHFEEGNAGQESPQDIDDDVSYLNHYVSAEFKVRLLEGLEAVFIVDYETNHFTSQEQYDEHRGASENVVQGEIEFLYELTDSTLLKLGWQHGGRKLTSEEQTVHNNNIWLAVEYGF